MTSNTIESDTTTKAITELQVSFRGLKTAKEEWSHMSWHCFTRGRWAPATRCACGILTALATVLVVCSENVVMRPMMKNKIKMILRCYSKYLKCAMPSYKLPLAGNELTFVQANGLTNKQCQNPVNVSTLESIHINGSCMIDWTNSVSLCDSSTVVVMCMTLVMNYIIGNLLRFCKMSFKLN